MTISPRGHSIAGAAGSDSEFQLAQIARAVDLARSGNPVRIGDGADGATVIFVETATERALLEWDAPASMERLLLLTHARARTLQIRSYTPEIVAIRLTPPLSLARLRAIADPTFDLEEPFKGPFETVREALPDSYPAAVKFAKLAGLLPAALVLPNERNAFPGTEIPVATVRDYESLVVRSLKLVTRARVPLEAAENAEILAFRAGGGEPEHYAIVIGDPARDRPVLTRLHSECFTGDLLGSLKCDCGAQLRGAIAAIAQAGGGILLYLPQEGRGIGLINKLRAYRLQDQGFDTVEANERLGFQSDERLYGVAARMLALLGYRSVRLMTNNPHKMQALQAAGIEVSERVPHAFPANAHNRDYLRAKAESSGHLL